MFAPCNKLLLEERPIFQTLFVSVRSRHAVRLEVFTANICCSTILRNEIKITYCSPEFIIKLDVPLHASRSDSQVNNHQMVTTLDRAAPCPLCQATWIDQAHRPVRIHHYSDDVEI